MVTILDTELVWLDPAGAIMNLHDHALSGAVDGKASNLHSMASHDGAHQGRLTHDLDELLTRVAVLVDLADVS